MGERNSQNAQAIFHTSFEINKVLYQPYGSINKNDHRNSEVAIADDLSEDRFKGYGSGSADRIYGNMTYNKPSLIVIDDSELFSTQGKHSITYKNRYKSI